MKLLIIDPNMSLTSPSMKGVVRSLDHWKSIGFQIEVWCWHCDEGLAIDEVRRLPRLGNLPIIAGLCFSFVVFCRAWWQYQMLGRTRPDVIYTIAWYHIPCDVAHVHFSPFDWERRQRGLGIHSWRDLAERLANAIYLLRARRFLRLTTARRLVCVSQAVADDMLEINPRLPVEVLPNCYDPARFHPGVREQFRASTRQQLGFDETHRVFIFVSTGHYRRKGFFLAVEALKHLRGRFPQTRLLVVGGRAERLAALQAELGEQHDWITFTGMVPDVERYFAAADAFLFPSYSEAFALVEVEAAACGLPLFLTPHHGSEMILEDGVNGRSIAFDPVRIAEVLATFLDGSWAPKGIFLKHAIDSASYARRLAAMLQPATP